MLILNKSYNFVCNSRKDVRLPVNMQRAMAAEAEASREARAKVVSANGEMKASFSLKTAADTINKSPVAIQLRYLQTLTHIAAEKNSTIIFPVPIELLSYFVQKQNANRENQDEKKLHEQQQQQQRLSSKLSLPHTSGIGCKKQA